MFTGWLVASGLFLGLNTQRLFNSCEMASRPGRAPACCPLHVTGEPIDFWAGDLGLTASNPRLVSGLPFVALVSSHRINDICIKCIPPGRYYQYFAGQTHPDPTPPTLLHPNALPHGRAQCLPRSPQHSVLSLQTYLGDCSCSSTVCLELKPKKVVCGGCEETWRGHAPVCTQGFCPATS